MHTVRQRHPSRHLFIGALLVALLAAMFPLAPAGAQSADYEILVVGKTLGFRHSHIDDTTNVLIDMGATNGFSVDVWDPRQPDLTLDSTPFTSAADLAKYATIVFVSPVDGTNNQDPARPRLLDDDELAAFQGYIHDGGGFVGLHAATDAMHAIPWYSQLTGGGARFRNHPAQQTATMRVESPAHPSTEILPLAWERFDEWYNFTTNPREDVHVLLTLDESTYNGGSMGDDHPIAWCQNFEGGRSWYEGAGHTDASYTDPLFVEHLLKGSSGPPASSTGAATASPSTKSTNWSTAWTRPHGRRRWVSAWSRNDWTRPRRPRTPVTGARRSSSSTSPRPCPAHSCTTTVWPRRSPTCPTGNRASPTLACDPDDRSCGGWSPPGGHPPPRPIVRVPGG